MAYTSVEKIAKVRLMCHKVLPAVYDESLSYLESLSKLTYKLNETIDSVNALDDNVEALNDTVTEFGTRLDAVEGEISGFEAEVTAKFNQLETEIYANVDAKVDEKLSEVDTKLAEVDAKVDSIDQQMSEFEATITEHLDGLEEKLTAIINAELEELNTMFTVFRVSMENYIKDEVAKALAEIPDLQNVVVIDPTTGKLDKIQNVVQNIMNFSAYYAFSCNEYNELGLTCDFINDIIVDSVPRGLTCYEWLRIAKKVLLTQVDERKAEKFAYPHSFVYDYLSGSLVWHDRNVDINQMLIASSGCYSCDELVTLGFTVNEIIGFAITAYQYVMRANNLMVRSA